MNNLNSNVTFLSVTELESLEKTLSIQLVRAQNGIIDDSFVGHDCKEVENILSEKLLAVHNLITAKKIRG